MARRSLVSRLGDYLRKRSAQTSAPPSDHQKAPSYTFSHPQRYVVNHDRYIARGGQVRVEEDVRAFVAGSPRYCTDMARYFSFCLIFDQIVKEGLKGDMAELGVYKGNTAALLVAWARRLGVTAWLLDTFEGFPEKDLQGVDAGKEMQFDDASLDTLRAVIGEESVRYVKGYFPESAAQIPSNTPFCLVHIDCDLYAPIKSALEYFYPRLVPGGFIVLHDYSSLYWDGAERAVDEFFADKPESPIPMPDAAGSAVVRKTKPADRAANWFVQSRIAGLSGDWIKTAQNSPGTEYLGDSWSWPEPWGVWGLGGKHTLRLFVPPLCPNDILLDVECQVLLLNSRTSQKVDVRLAGHTLAVWDFTPENNQCIRTVRIPAELASVAASQENFPVVCVEFHPWSVQSPSELCPGYSDSRTLGLGLHAIRLRYADQPR